MVRVHSVVAVAFTALGLGRSEEAAAQAPLSSEYACAHPPYKAHLFSRNPLVIYLEGFVSSDERLRLQHQAEGTFAHSNVVDAEGNLVVQSVRTSRSATLHREPVVRCIEQRAADFQGFDTTAAHVEPIQLVKYAATERYNFHTDWLDEGTRAVAPSMGGNRVSSFFAYVKAANVTGGGTNFPLLAAPRDERWCRFVDCDDEYANGVTFRPIEGNAVYWENLLPGGRGDSRLMHAGLPVVEGEKIGMNIWTRQAPLDPVLRGD